MPHRIEIPPTLPVMVLPGCSLLPRGLLPLRIFEPRYRAMLADCLASERLFCIGTQDDDPPKRSGAAGVLPYSTASVIRACVAQEDGTSQLILMGLRSIRIVDWLDEGKPYPHARVEAMVDVPSDEPRCADLAQSLYREAAKLPSPPVEGGDGKGWEASLADAVENPQELCELVACRVLDSPESHQQILSCPSLEERLLFVIDRLGV